MIVYKVKLTHDIHSDATKSIVEVVARVVELDEGNEKKVTNGNVVFSRKGESDVSKTLTNGVAKFEFELDRKDEDYLARVEAEYTDPRDYTASESIRITIPAKKGQPPVDPRTSRATLFLAQPTPQPEDDKVVFKANVKLNASPKALDARYPIQIFLDDQLRPEKPLTEKETGEAFIRFSVDKTDRRQDYLLSTRVTVDGKTIASGRSYPIFIPAKDVPKPKEEWELFKVDLDLKGQRLDGDDPDEYKFVLTVQAIPLERLKTDHSRERKAKLDPDGYDVRYFEDWSKTPLPEISLTDKNGFAETEVVKEAGDKNARKNFIAQAEAEVWAEDPKNPGTMIKVKRQFTSNEYHETLPKKKAKKDTPKDAVKLEVSCEDEVARVRGLDKDNQPCDTELSMLAHRPSVIIRDSANADVTGKITIPKTGGTFFFFDNSPTPDVVRVDFSIVGFTTTDIVFPRSK